MKIESDNLRKFLKEVTPDGYKSESHEHGYTDAIIVVDTRLDLLEMQELAERGNGQVELPVMPKIAKEILNDQEVERLVDYATKSYRSGKDNSDLWDIVKTLARGCRERSAKISALEKK
jgi:hypothetical protein